MSIPCANIEEMTEFFIFTCTKKILTYIPSTGRILHELIDVSMPNLPHFPRHVCINVPNAHSHVSETISINHRRL